MNHLLCKFCCFIRAMLIAACMAWILTGMSSSAAAEECGTWTAGKYSIKAKFLRQDETNVYLQGENGKELKVPLAQLADEDQKYLREQKESDNPFKDVGQQLVRVPRRQRQLLQQPPQQRRPQRRLIPRNRFRSVTQKKRLRKSVGRIPKRFRPIPPRNGN